MSKQLIKQEPYSQIQISVLDPLTVIEDVLKQLKTVSIMYGYKMPEEVNRDSKEPIATNLAKFVINNFGSLEINEIESAFEMASTGKLNVNIESYGKILIIPILSNVLQAYRTKRNIKRSQKPKETHPDERELNRLNCLAVLQWLVELEVKEKLHVKHYETVNRFIYKFTDEEKRKVWAEELKKEEIRISNLASSGKYNRIEIMEFKNNKVKESGNNTQIRLVTEYVRSNDIDYKLIESKINKHYGQVINNNLK